MHRQNFSSQQQNNVQEYAVNQDSNQYHQQQLLQQQQQQLAQQQRITRTEHTIRQVTQQRGQFEGFAFYYNRQIDSPNPNNFVKCAI